jgi:hypothetical protein
VTEGWIEATRAIGLSNLLLNVIRTSHAPLRIYETPGSERIDRYAECAEPIEVDPCFVHLEYALG